jgi:hypothetical protein
MFSCLMAQVVRINYPTRNNVEKIKTIIKIYAVLKKSRISDLQITIMAYLIIYGINGRTRDLVINQLKLCSTLNSYKKAMTVLRRERMLVRDQYNTRYEIPSDIKIDPKEDMKLLICIQKPKVLSDEELQATMPGSGKAAGPA